MTKSLFVSFSAAVLIVIITLSCKKDNTTTNAGSGKDSSAIRAVHQDAARRSGQTSDPRAIRWFKEVS